jgi:hypothetical protein
MAYFSDLTFYSYGGDGEPGTKNIGWLQRRHEFAKAVPSEDTLDLLWDFCKAPVMQARGFHLCDLCGPSQAILAVRNGIELRLGNAEIRVFSQQSDRSRLLQDLREAESGGLLFLRKSTVPCNVYAAPTLIYHYVHTHHYKPPDEFLRALTQGPKPSSEQYSDLLEKLDLE